MTLRAVGARIASLGLLLLLIAATVSAAVLPPSTDPTAVNAGATVTVGVTSLVTDDTVIPGSVNVQRVDAGGRVLGVLATLRDDGTNGDLLAGDRVFSGRFTLSETSVGQVRIRVSAALRGVLLRPASAPAVIDVLPQGIPTRLFASDIGKAVVDTDGRSIMPDEVFACFRDGVDVATVQSIGRAIAGTIIGRAPVGNCYQFRLPAGSTAVTVHNALATLGTFAEVVAADPAGLRQPTSVPVTATSEFIRVRFPHAQAFSRGNNVLVAVIDTGVNYLDGRLAPVIAGPNTMANDPPASLDPMDDCGHGTHVAGIVRGTAPGSTILAVRTSTCAGGTFAQSTAGIVAAANAGARILNLSYSGERLNLMEAAAVLYAQVRGALVIAAAGNTNGSPVPQYPAALPGVVSVGSVDRVGHPDPATASGPWIKVWAPGVGIESTGLTKPIETLSGTSQATPFVSGTAALIWARQPGWGAAQVASQITSNLVFPGGCASPTGVGQLDALAAVTSVNAIDVTPDDPTLASGDTVALVAAAKDSCNRPVSLPAGALLKWESSRPDVAEIDLASGVATGAIRPGKAEISAVETKIATALSAYCIAEGISPCQIKKLEGEAPENASHPRRRVEITVPARTLTVTASGTGAGTVVSDPAGIDCDPSCAQQAVPFALSVPLTLSAFPATGSIFGGWGGDCSGTSSSVAVTMADDRHCTAQFNPACQTFTPSGAGFPRTVTQDGSATITTTTPNGTNSFTVSFQQPTPFASPQSAAQAVLGNAVNGLFTACGGVFPTASGSRVDQAGIFRLTTTANAGGGTLTVQETGDNTQPANDGNCPAICQQDTIHYVKTWQYDIQSGNYTIGIVSDRHLVSFNPGTSTTIVSISHSAGSVSGKQ